MVKTVACRGLGSNCDFVLRGETVDELITGMEKHGKEVHNMTDEQVKSPQMTEKLKSIIKNE